MSNPTTHDGVGGGIPERGISTTSPMHFQPLYPDVTDSVADRRQDFKALMGRCARHMLETCPDLTLKQKQLLRDVERGRYDFKVFSQLLEIAPTSANPSLLSEEFRRQTMLRQARRPLSVIDTWLDETVKQGAADVAQSGFIVERTSCRRDMALDRLVPHFDSLRSHIDSLLLWTPKSWA